MGGGFVTRHLRWAQSQSVGDDYLIVLSPTAPNSSYEDIELTVEVEYSNFRPINSTVPLTFRYAGNPDINDLTPKRIRNR